MAGYVTPSWTNGTTPAINADALTEMGQAIELAEHPYGVCSTAAATAAKTVSIDFSGALSLFTGMSIKVRFSNANTAASPTLNVNGTGAKAIVSPGYTGTITWSANQVLDLTYNGSQWVLYNIDAYTKTQSLSGTTATLMNTKFGSTPSTPDAALALLANAMPSSGTGAQFATGTYTGTGTYGSSNPKTINVGFPPKLVLIAYGGSITVASNLLVWFSGISSARAGTTNQMAQITTSGNTISLTAVDAASQMNQSGLTYQWFAIGG